MSLYMNIFHGRSWDEDQKQSFLETGDDWGSRGPQLINIDAVHYQERHLLLQYSSFDDIVDASDVTSWAIVSVSPFHRADILLKVRFTGDLMSCYDRVINRMFYFGVFNIENLDGDFMKMHLRMDENYGKGFSAEIREIILENITDLRFTYGAYSVCFENEGHFLMARYQTGWVEGVLDYSLELPIGANRTSLFVKSRRTNHIPLLYGSFELTSM